MQYAKITHKTAAKFVFGSSSYVCMIEGYHSRAVVPPSAQLCSQGTVRHDCSGVELEGYPVLYPYCMLYEILYDNIIKIS